MSPAVIVVALLLALLIPNATAEQATGGRPLRLAIAGLVHGHVSGFLRGAQGRQDVEIVGIFEPDTALLAAVRRSLQHSRRRAIHQSGRRCSNSTKPEAVASFTNTLDHPAIVEAAAARHIPVMMEKPLAVSNADAQRIKRAADRGGIQVFVNYETTWYPSHGEIWSLIKEQKAAGDIRKMVAMDGHQGPKAINVQPEFFAWLSDPVKNGAGALYDFGCYGSNLMTWLMDGQRPIAVTAVTQHFQPSVYPRSTTRRRLFSNIRMRRASSRHPGTGRRIVRTWRFTANVDTRLRLAATAFGWRCPASQSRQSRRRRARPTNTTRSRT